MDAFDNTTSFGTSPCDAPRGRSFEWDAAAESQLARLWASGCSAQRIAEELGVTRNAVMGKVHRMGLQRRPTAHGAAKIDRSPVAMVLEPRLPKLPPIETRLSAPPRPVSAGSEPRPNMHVSIYDLTETTCQWPIGDPQDRDGFCFCGGQSVPGLPYCGWHARKAYTGAMGR